MISASILSEFQRYKRIGEGAIAQIPDEKLVKVFGSDNNSIAVLIGHVSGNLKSRFTDFLTSDGEKPWRNRDGEFEEKEMTRDELLRKWEDGWNTLFQTLEDLPDEAMEKTVVIRGIELSVLDAYHRSLTHISYHIGQIVYIARMIAGDNWKSLSIPRGKSAEYNKNPTKER